MARVFVVSNQRAKAIKPFVLNGSSSRAVVRESFVRTHSKRYSRALDGAVPSALGRTRRLARRATVGHHRSFMRLSAAAAALLVALGCDLKGDDENTTSGGTGAASGTPGSSGGGGGGLPACDDQNVAACSGSAPVGGAGFGGMCAGASGAGVARPCVEETSGYCGAWAAKLRECGVLDSGCFGGCVNYGDAAEVCETACMTSATCEAVVDFQCDEGVALIDCLGACIGEAPFTCGDGTILPYFYLCDGFEDCLSGEDELDCPAEPALKCRNVSERVPISRECDGIPDCSDASDEPPACQPEFTCDCTLGLSRSLVCDGFPDCLDGSDEPATCGTTTCAAGP